LCLSFFLWPAHADAAKPKAKFELKIATIAPDGSTWMRIMDDLAAEIFQETGGDVGLKFYAGGVQGEDAVVLRKIRAGQLHGGGFTGVGLGEIASAVRVMETPFLFRDQSEVNAVQQKMEPVFDELLRQAGWELLGWSDVGFVYLLSKSPIARTEDLRRTKMWLWEGDPLAEALLKTLGVAPVPLPITDVVTSLQTGMIDAVYTSPTACIALQWFTRVSHLTDLPVTHAVGAVVVSKEAFAKISPANQAKVKEICRKHFARLSQAIEEENKASLGVLQQKGVKLVSLSAADRAAFEGVGQEVQERLVGQIYPREMLDQVLAALREIRGTQR